MIIEGLGAVVTGGASGLGEATARLLAAKGARVAILDVNPERGEAVAKEIGGLFAKVDVSDEASVTDGLDLAQSRHGVGRVLVNCAGIAPPAKTIDREGRPHSLEHFERIIRVNLIGTFNMLSKFAARAAQADLVGEERGVIVNTASVAAFEGQIGQAAYSASKGGVVGLTLPVARDLAASAIRVVTIAPGLLMTPMMAALPEPAREALAKVPPFPTRLGKPEEYAMLVDSIVSNPLLNGETIRLDGAVRLPPR